MSENGEPNGSEERWKSIFRRRHFWRDRPRPPASSKHPGGLRISTAPISETQPNALFMQVSVKKGELSDPEIAQFLSGLSEGDWCPEKQAYSSYFIKIHGDQIEDYIRDKVSSNFTLSTKEWEKNVRSLLDYYAVAPKGFAYNPSTGALEVLSGGMKSFRLYSSARSSLTLPGLHWTAQLGGYAVALLVAGLVLWAGHELSKAIRANADGWVMLMNEWIHE